MSGPAPGTIGLVPMGGYGGRLIRIGQALNGDGFEDFEHAFVGLGGGQVIEAEPGGARIVPMRDDGVWGCEGIAGLLAGTDPAVIAVKARDLRGIPYSWADYAALAAHRLHLPVPGLRDYVKASGHLICSQLCDLLYQRLGARVFDDQRWNGYVTPAALYQRDLELRSKS